MTVQSLELLQTVIQLSGVGIDTKSLHKIVRTSEILRKEPGEVSILRAKEILETVEEEYYRLTGADRSSSMEIASIGELIEKIRRAR